MKNLVKFTELIRHRKKKIAYIDSNNAGRSGISSGRCSWNELAFEVIAWFEPEKNFFLSNFREIELSLIEGLKYLVNPEFCWSFLEMASLVKLCNKAPSPRNDPCRTTGHIIAEKATTHSILPLTQQQIVQETHLRLLLG